MTLVKQCRSLGHESCCPQAASRPLTLPKPRASALPLPASRFDSASSCSHDGIRTHLLSGECVRLCSFRPTMFGPATPKYQQRDEIHRRQNLDVCQPPAANSGGPADSYRRHRPYSRPLLVLDVQPRRRHDLHCLALANTLNSQFGIAEGQQSRRGDHPVVRIAWLITPASSDHLEPIGGRNRTTWDAGITA